MKDSNTIMKSKIKQYSALSVAALAVSLPSCSEEGDITTGADIDFQAINKVLSYSGSGTAWELIDSIDVDGDGNFDFAFGVTGYFDADDDEESKYGYFYGLNDYYDGGTYKKMKRSKLSGDKGLAAARKTAVELKLNEVLTNLEKFKDPYDDETDTVFMLKPLSSGATLNSASTIWQSYGCSGYQYSGYYGDLNISGITDGKDKFIGFRFVVDEKHHYGWAKVNFASNYKAVTIKEIAYNKTPEEAIKIGAKK